MQLERPTQVESPNNHDQCVHSAACSSLLMFSGADEPPRPHSYSMSFTHIYYFFLQLHVYPNSCTDTPGGLQLSREPLVMWFSVVPMESG